MSEQLQQVKRRAQDIINATVDRYRGTPELAEKMREALIEADRIVAEAKGFEPRPAAPVEEEPAA